MTTAKQKIKDQFNKNASSYDYQRKMLIPCFDDFYSIPTSILETKKENPSVLDIGAGTGLFSSLIKKKYPKASIFVDRFI